jgi:hypothetical protein
VRRVVVSRVFLDDHVQADIVPDLQKLAFLVCLRMAGSRRVVVKKSDDRDRGGRVIVEPNYRGFRFEVDAVPERDRFNAEVRIRRLAVHEDPHVAFVNCWKQTVTAAERAGALWARRWIDSRLYSE